MRRALLIAIGRFVATLSLGACATQATAQPPVTAMAFTPRGEHLIVGSQTGLDIRTWPSLEKNGTFTVDLKQIHDLAFSSDGKRLLIVGGSPSEYGEWKVFSWPDRQEIANSVQHDDVIYSAVWQTNARFATGAADSLVMNWQLENTTVTEISRLTAHSRRVLAVAVLDHGNLLLSAGVDQSLRVWRGVGNSNVADGDTDLDSTDTSQLIRVLDNHTGIVRDLAARPGEHAIPYVASAGADKTVRIWQPTIGRLVRFARLPAEPLSIAWSADGNWLAAGCVDGRLRIVNPTTVQIVSEIEAIEGWAYEVAAAPDGSFAVGGSGGQVVRVANSPEL